MFFATSILHVHLMQWDDESLIEAAVSKCDQIWETIQPENVCVYISFINSFFFLHVPKRKRARF